MPLKTDLTPSRVEPYSQLQSKVRLEQHLAATLALRIRWVGTIKHSLP